MIVADLKTPNDFKTVLKDINEELCREKECSAVIEVFMDSNSRANLIQPIPQLTKSRGDQK